MKNLFGKFLLMVTLTMLVSCGHKEVEEIKAELSTTDVDGNLSDVVEPMSNTITITGDYITYASAKFKVSRLSDLKENEIPLLRLNLVNEDGTIHSNMEIDYDDRTKLKSALSEGNQTITVKFKGYDKLSTSIEKFYVSSTINIKQSSSSDIDTEDINSSDIDDLLDDYDEYMTEYLKLYKKVQSGDNDILEDYNKLLEKITKLSKKLENIDADKMSNEQIKRLNSISSRMAGSL